MSGERIRRDRAAYVNAWGFNRRVDADLVVGSEAEGAEDVGQGDLLDVRGCFGHAGRELFLHPGGHGFLVEVVGCDTAVHDVAVADAVGGDVGGDHAGESGAMSGKRSRRDRAAYLKAWGFNRRVDADLVVGSEAEGAEDVGKGDLLDQVGGHRVIRHEPRVQRLHVQVYGVDGSVDDLLGGDGIHFQCESRRRPHHGAGEQRAFREGGAVDLGGIDGRIVGDVFVGKVRGLHGHGRRGCGGGIEGLLQVVAGGVSLVEFGEVYIRRDGHTRRVHAVRLDRPEHLEVAILLYAHERLAVAGHHQVGRDLDAFGEGDRLPGAAVATQAVCPVAGGRDVAAHGQFLRCLGGADAHTARGPEQDLVGGGGREILVGAVGPDECAVVVGLGAAPGRVAVLADGFVLGTSRHGRDEPAGGVGEPAADRGARAAGGVEVPAGYRGVAIGCDVAPASADGRAQSRHAIVASAADGCVPIGCGVADSAADGRAAGLDLVAEAPGHGGVGSAGAVVEPAAHGGEVAVGYVRTTAPAAAADGGAHGPDFHAVGCMAHREVG